MELVGKEQDTVAGEQVNVRNCTVQSVTGEHITLEQSAAIFVAGDKVECKDSAALVVVAQEIHGDIRPIFSLPAALIIAGAIIFGFTIFRKK